MNIGRAEIGIVLTGLINLAQFSIPPFSFFFVHPPWDSMEYMTTTYVLFCGIAIIGMILLVSDRKGFLRRRKSKMTVSALLIFLGSILMVESFFIGTFLGHFPYWEQYTFQLVYWIWNGLGFVSGILWLACGLMEEKHEHNMIQPSKQDM